MHMKRPETRKQIHALTRKVAKLNRFISRSSVHLRPFFKVLKGASSGEWNAKRKKTFQFIKEYLPFPSVLSQPKEGEELFIYLIASTITLSATLVRVNKDKGQKSVYFVSKVLSDVESSHMDFERIA